MSTEDIASGSGWSQEIRINLQASNYGILFVTRENHDQPWLMFEAGALAKHVSDNAKVVPLIVDDDLKPEALSGPLAQFQAKQWSKDNVFRIVKDLNDECDVSLSSERLSRCFDANWERLSKAMKDLPDAEGEAPKLDQDAMLSEILQAVRSIQKPSGFKMRVRPFSGTGRGMGNVPRHSQPFEDQYRRDAAYDTFRFNVSNLRGTKLLTPAHLQELDEAWDELCQINSHAVTVKLDTNEGRINVRMKQDGSVEQVD